MATIRGGDRLALALSRIAAQLDKGGRLRVGFLENSTYPDGTSVPMVAAIQEFGAPSRGIPPRPYFRNMIAAKSEEWPDAIAGALRANDYDAEKALELAGHGIKGQLQQSIVDTMTPPNAESTIAKKGFDDPLIGGTQDSGGGGHMLNSVDFEISSK